MVARNPGALSDVNGREGSDHAWSGRPVRDELGTVVP